MQDQTINYSKSDWHYTTEENKHGPCPNDDFLSEHYLCHTSCRWTNAGTSEVFCEVPWTEGSTRPQELVSLIDCTCTCMHALASFPGHDHTPTNTYFGGVCGCSLGTRLMHAYTCTCTCAMLTVSLSVASLPRLGYHHCNHSWSNDSPSC